MSVLSIISTVTIIGLCTKFVPWRIIKNVIQYDLYFLIMNIIYAIVDAKYRSKNILKNPQNRKDHIAIVTGGGRGIGPEIVKILMKNGMKVIMAVRKPELCKDIMKEMRKNYPEGKVSAMYLDISSMNSVQNFCKSFLSEYSKLHILVNNAGIYYGGFNLTNDGFEEKLATNYLGHFLMTHLLMETLKESAEECEFHSRVVHVSSCYHFNANISFDDINLKDDYAVGKSYAQSKLAQIMFCRSLDRLFEDKHSKVRSYVVHPGIVGSDMFKTGMKMLGSWFVGLSKYVKSSEEGGTSVAFACLSPTLENNGGGKYLSNCVEANSSDYSKLKIHQDKLFELTMRMLHIQKFGVTE